MVQKVKIVLLGQENVGKTSLIHRLTQGELLRRPEATIGVTFKSHKVYHGSKELDLNIWDTAGQERFSHFLPLYVHHAHIALVCFELPKMEQVERYVQMVRESDPQIIILLVATKSDLYGIPIGDRIELIHPSMEEYANQEGLELYYTSSKTGQNVDKVFERAVEMLEERGLLWGWEPQTIDLSAEEEISIPESRCC